MMDCIRGLAARRGGDEAEWTGQDLDPGRISWTLLRVGSES